MITIQDSIPKRSQRGLQGQDIIWTQFNEVNFYVEDVYEENFYFQILKKLFSGIKISKIFPLGGKGPVLTMARDSIGDKTKVFILDKDFDDILENKTNQTNIFYLEKYSIENHLLEENGIIDLIIEENPKIQIANVRDQLKFDDFLAKCVQVFAELSSNLLIIRKFNLGIKYLKIDTARDCVINASPSSIKYELVKDFYNTIEAKLKAKFPRLKYTAQIKKCYRYFSGIQNCLRNTPGKYLINFLKAYLKKVFPFTQFNSNNFHYRLAKNCSLGELNTIKSEVLQYIG